MVLTSQAVAAPKHTQQMLVEAIPACLELAASQQSLASVAKKYGYTSWHGKYRGVPHGVVFEKSYGLMSNAFARFRYSRLVGGCQLDLWSKPMRKDADRWQRVLNMLRASGANLANVNSQSKVLVARLTYKGKSLTLRGRAIREGLELILEP